MKQILIFLIMFILGCAGALSVPLFDEKAVLEKYPSLSGVIIKAEEYKPQETDTDSKEIWIVDDNRIISKDMKLKVEVTGYPEFSYTYVIPSDGVISMKYIRRLETLGKTLRRLKEEIENQLSAYLKEPQVIISVCEYRRSLKKGAITILGMVNKVGAFNSVFEKKVGENVVEEPLTLFMALAKSNGMKTDAAITQIMVIRKISKGFNIIVCDWARFCTLNDFQQNITLEADDIVVIPALYSEEEAFPKELTYIVAYVEGKLTKEQLRFQLEK